MLVEGKGMVAQRELALAASRRTAFRRYGARADRWGRGMLKRIDPVLAGLLGEYAAINFVNRALKLRLTVDTALRQNGDGGIDLDVHGYLLQVKTRDRTALNRIRRLDNKKRIVPISCDAFVFAKLVGEHAVELLGWVPAEVARDAGSFRKSPVRDADWFNIDLPDSALLPMGRLIERIRLHDGGAR